MGVEISSPDIIAKAHTINTTQKALDGSTISIHHALGYRPRTTKPGEWSDATVVYSSTSSTGSSGWRYASFDKGMDYVMDQDSYATPDHIRQLCTTLEEADYQPMSREDIRLTAGI